MARILPLRSETPDVTREPRLVAIDDEAADEVFAALSSDTSRDILARLYEDPATASDLAEAVDTSIQNARYHLEKLESAGLIEPIDTWYSSRGTEMTVYGPTSEPLVVAAGEEESHGVLRSALKRVVGAVGVLGIASVAIDRLASRFGDLAAGGDAGASPGGGQSAEIYDSSGTTTDAGGLGGGAGGGAGTSTTTASPMPTGVEIETRAPETPSATPSPSESVETAVSTSTPRSTPIAREASPTPAPSASATPEPMASAAPGSTTTSTPGATPEPGNASALSTEATRVAERELTRTVAADGGVESLDTALSPGLAFFAGGLLVVGLVAIWWYWTRYRPLYAG